MRTAPSPKFQQGPVGALASFNVFAEVRRTAVRACRAITSENGGTG